VNSGTTYECPTYTSHEGVLNGNRIKHGSSPAGD
jgi:hypothetical protein